MYYYDKWVGDAALIQQVPPAYIGDWVSIRMPFKNFVGQFLIDNFKVNIIPQKRNKGYAIYKIEYFVGLNTNIVIF